MPISRTIRVVPAWGLLLLAGFLPGLLAGGENSNWPSFRGPSAVGVMAGQNLPDKWDAGSGVGIRFKVEIPGLAHSSPVIWGDRLFVTTAVSSEWYASFKPGLYVRAKHPEIITIRILMVEYHWLRKQVSGSWGSSSVSSFARGSLEKKLPLKTCRMLDRLRANPIPF